MKTSHIIDALCHAHPWIHRDRMMDLLLETRADMPQFSTPFECGRALLFRLDVQYESEQTPEGWFDTWTWFRP